MGGTYTLVEKFRVNLVGKVNVEHWGLCPEDLPKVYFNARKKLKVKMREACGCIVSPFYVSSPLRKTNIIQSSLLSEIT